MPIKEFKYYDVQIPNPLNIEGSWCDCGTFMTKKEALIFAQNLFGADDKGRINVIGEYIFEEDEEED